MTARGKGNKMKITKDQLRQMIREALREEQEPIVLKVADEYIERFGGVEKAVKMAKGKDMEEKKLSIIRNMKSDEGKRHGLDFYHLNKAAFEVVKRYGESK